MTHGTRRAYREAGCRCSDCRAAVAREQNVYVMRRDANGGDPLTVPKVTAVRRVRALMALGWPRRELSRQMGYKGDALGPILSSPRDRLTLATDQRIRDLYDRLSGTPGPSAEARRRALAAGWPPPLAWDDIDDPDERPACGVRSDRGRPRDDIDEVVVERLLALQQADSTRAEKEEAMRRWTDAGKSIKALCDAHGWRHGRYAPKRQEDAA